MPGLTPFAVAGLSLAGYHVSIRTITPHKIMSIIQTIQQARQRLRKSELKVCEYILKHQEEIIHMRIVDLASAAEVSEPTVVRFCRAINCSGFQDFKLQLAQHLATRQEFEPFKIADTDSVGDLSMKVFDATLATLEQVRDAISPATIEAAINALSRAKRVEFYGFGASAAVAADAQHKFFRLKISSAVYSDPHIQLMSAMSLTDDDVVIAISQSGQTDALIDAMRIANEYGATTIALAPGNSLVAKEANIAIAIDAEEEVEIYTPLSSRIAHLVVIDLLAVGVAQRIGPTISQHLQAVHKGLKTLRQGE
ncbi:HTH-type transcriptional regulator HexR [BD1-7 clade bacterium]|uniref:HTH-type transcriptional regulator HexR n=1 Tax=BD1-7 clade bacterium TaxID=2029982 RepID=A0A5S9QC36_9GAMM|nr:HTH-type transcriptional regulator HexR [BD1-7 clade bacterium]